MVAPLVLVAVFVPRMRVFIGEIDNPPIGYQILKKSETFGLKQCFSYPPGGGGGWSGIIGIWEKKNQDYWYLRRQKSVFGRPKAGKF